MAPVMSVMRLSEYRGGQWRFKGQVVCFPQDIQPVVSVLRGVSVDVLVLRTQQSANADAVNFGSVVKGCSTHFSGSWSTTATR